MFFYSSVRMSVILVLLLPLWIRGSGAALLICM